MSVQLTSGTLYGVRQSLNTGAYLLTDRQTTRLNDLIVDDIRLVIEVSSAAHQAVGAACRDEGSKTGWARLARLIDSIVANAPSAIPEVVPWDAPWRLLPSSPWSASTSVGPPTPTESVDGPGGNSPGFPITFPPHRLLVAGIMRIQAPALKPQIAKSHVRVG